MFNKFVDCGSTVHIFLFAYTILQAANIGICSVYTGNRSIQYVFYEYN
jgi:hypothetical protein